MLNYTNILIGANPIKFKQNFVKIRYLYGNLLNIFNMAATRRLNAELVKKYSAIENISTDPIEKIRAQCLSRGASGIKGFGRYMYTVFIEW